MFNSVSKIGAGAVITLIETILQLFGIDVPGGAVGHAVEGFMAVVGLVLIIWGQLGRKDLTAGLIRK